MENQCTNPTAHNVNTPESSNYRQMNGILHLLQGASAAFQGMVMTAPAPGCGDLAITGIGRRPLVIPLSNMNNNNVELRIRSLIDTKSAIIQRNIYSCQELRRSMEAHAVHVRNLRLRGVSTRSLEESNHVIGSMVEAYQFLLAINDKLLESIVQDFQRLDRIKRQNALLCQNQLM